LKKRFEDFEEERKDENPDFVYSDMELWEFDYAGRNRKFTQYLKDGIKLNGNLKIENNIPVLYVNIPYDDMKEYFGLWFTPEMERFIFAYLHTGKTTGVPKLFLKQEDITFRADENYIYRHLKRELERNAELTCIEVENGINIIAHYPYGSINYGILPHNIEELSAILENMESWQHDYSEYDIPKLHSANLSREEIYIAEEERLDKIFPNGIPSNIILDKTVCGIGATYSEIEIAKRNSIIIEPNVPVIMGKEKEHKQIIGVYDEMTVKEIIDQIAERKIDKEKYIKILTTPESFPKVIKALNALEIPYRETFFLLFDECDKIISDIDFREKIIVPIDEFFLFTSKSMVSATPIICDDPRFKEQEFKIIKITPKYNYSKKLELKPTNNVSLMLKRTIEKLNQEEEEDRKRRRGEEEKDVKFCIFFNYVAGIKDITDYLGLSPNEVSIYCSEKKCKELKGEKDWEENVFNRLNYNEDKTVNLSTKYNFFTSRFYSAVDIKLKEKPIVIMVSMVYKFLPNEMPFTLIDPATDAVQIAGRFRNGISRLIHITDTNPNPKLKWKSKKELEHFLNEQYSGYTEMRKLAKKLSEYGEKYIVNQAIDKTDFVKEGYVNKKGEINYFRWNNAYLDERLKMLYFYPAQLYKAYSNSGAFEVYSESDYCTCSEQELKEIRNSLNDKKFQLLYKIYIKLINSLKPQDRQMYEELKSEFPDIIEAFEIIGYQRIRQLKFVKSDIKAEVMAVKREKGLAAEKVEEDVYSIFEVGEIYTNKFIKDELQKIFDKHNVIGRNAKTKDILKYFEIEEARTSGVRQLKMLSKLID